MNLDRDWVFKCSQTVGIHLVIHCKILVGLLTIWKSSVEPTLIFFPPFKNGKGQIIASSLKKSIWWVKSAYLAWWFLWRPETPSLMLCYGIDVSYQSRWMYFQHWGVFQHPWEVGGWRNQVGHTSLCFCFSKSVLNPWELDAAAKCFWKKISTCMACSGTL